MAGHSWLNMTSRCTVLKICCSESNARPDSSLSIRSGLSCIIVLSFMCLSALCHLEKYQMDSVV